MKRWRLPNGQVLAQLKENTFVLLDEYDGVMKFYSPRSYAYEFDQYQWNHVVENEQLIEQTVIQGFTTQRTSTRVELDGLHQLTDTESPTQTAVEAALAAHTAQESGKKSADQAIVTKLSSGAAAIAPTEKRQRQRLVERVEHHKDELSKAMLTILDGLTKLQKETAGPLWSALETTIQCLHEASAFVTFDPKRLTSNIPPFAFTFGDVPSEPQGPLLPVLVEPRGRLTMAHERQPTTVTQQALALADALEDLTKKIVHQADVQSYVDARHNAACYLQAAGICAAAAESLANACRHLVK